jgi:tRNA threonylcarbamoyladenosine biosynthesis protein TsaB
MLSEPAKLDSALPALVIDGCGHSVFVGILGSDRAWRAVEERPGAPLENLFPAVETVLARSGLGFADLRGYLYCAGPGSILGLRLCAMAIETWARLFPQSARYFSYNSLQLTAAALLEDKPDARDALLVSDWKKNAWNAVYIREGTAGPIEPVDNSALEAGAGTLYLLPQRKGWQKPPAKARTLDYEPMRLDTLSKTPGLLRPTAGVELYSSGVNTFHKWVPERHRADSVNL